MINTQPEILSPDIFDTTKDKLLDFFTVEKKLNHFKNRANKLITEGKMEEQDLDRIDTVKQFIYIYNFLIMHGSQIVTVYNENNPIFINPMFNKIKGLSNSEITTRLLNGEHMLQITYGGLPDTIFKARKYLSRILKNEIVGYRNAEFKLPVVNENGESEIKSILWNTLKLSNGINIRLGFDAKENIEYFKEEFIETIDFTNMLTFSKKIDRIFNKLRFSSLDNQGVYKHIRLMALIMDLYIYFGSMPVSIYRGSEPRVLNKSFLDISGYSEAEIKNYFRQFGSVVPLFYKGKELEKVQKHLEYLKKTGYTGNGYEDVDFTITSKVDKEGNYRNTTVGWNSFIVSDLTVRSGIIKKVETLNFYDK